MPTRTAPRVARGPRRPQPANARTEAGARRCRAPTGRAAHRHQPVRHRHRGDERRDPRRAGSGQLGDLLFAKPGITGSSFAPGASSRPIIRGLDVNRVGIVENGTQCRRRIRPRRGSLRPGRSARDQPDRGGARARPRLRYGSTSIGGVVERDQQPDSGGVAVLRAVVPDLRHAGEGTACGMRRPRLASPPRRAPRSARSTAASKAACCSTPAAAILPSTPTRMAAPSSDYAIPGYPYLNDPRNS